MDRINLDGGGGNDTYTIRATDPSVSLNIKGGGSATVNLGNSGILQDIQGLVVVTNQPAHTNIVIDDSGDATPQNFILGTNADGVFGYIHDTTLPNLNIVYKYADTSSISRRTGVT